VLEGKKVGSSGFVVRKKGQHSRSLSMNSSVPAAEKCSVPVCRVAVQSPFGKRGGIWCAWENPPVSPFPKGGTRCVDAYEPMPPAPKNVSSLNKFLSLFYRYKINFSCARRSEDPIKNANIEQLHWTCFRKERA
jgi:hypothetical protein